MTVAKRDLYTANLTRLEQLALASMLNVADGHARQDLTDGQQQIVDDLPTLFAKSVGRSVVELEHAACEGFFSLLGQHAYPRGRDQVLVCYSSSVCMEILARSLVAVTDTVALIHPTFDNIPDILLGFALDLLPLEEGRVMEGRLDPEALRAAGCVFITTPNNPTGRVLPAPALHAIAAQCARDDVLLALDTSFRGFDRRAQYDHYAVLAESGCRYVVIEDTGKLWPTLDLKIGVLAASDNTGLPLADIHSDILLGVSPLILAVVERFVADAAAGGLDRLHAAIAANRWAVRGLFAETPGVTFPDHDSRVSVERLELAGRRGTQLWKTLSDRQVYVLPCRQFHWADQDRGEPFIRIALARPRDTVVAAAEQIRLALTQ